jgi:hypothetical protein
MPGDLQIVTAFLTPPTDGSVSRCLTQLSFSFSISQSVDRFCGLTVIVPGYITEIYRVSCEVRTLTLLKQQVQSDCVGFVADWADLSLGPGSHMGTGAST